MTGYENSKSRLLCPITPQEANLGPITHHADNLGRITSDVKPLCHPELSKEQVVQPVGLCL